MTCRADEIIVPLMGFCGFIPSEGNGEESGVIPGDIDFLSCGSRELMNPATLTPHVGENHGSNDFLGEFAANPPFTGRRDTLLDPSIVREDPNNPIGRHLAFKEDEESLSPILVRRYSDASALTESQQINKAASLTSKSDDVLESTDDKKDRLLVNTSASNNSTFGVQNVSVTMSHVSVDVQSRQDLGSLPPSLGESNRAQEAHVDPPAVGTTATTHDLLSEIGENELLQNKSTLMSNTPDCNVELPQQPPVSLLLTTSNISQSGKENSLPTQIEEQLPKDESFQLSRLDTRSTLKEAVAATKVTLFDELGESTEDASSYENLDNQRKLWDLTSAKKQLDDSSLIFSERIRGAANLRKLEVVRSRDHFAAKEREQILSIAASKEKVNSERKAPREAHSVRQTRSLQKLEDGPYYRPFKALPLPTASVGDVGLRGVPKVAKHRATTPVSPSLGPRRRDSSANLSRQSSSSSINSDGVVRSGVQTSLTRPSPKISSHLTANPSTRSAIPPRISSAPKANKTQPDYATVYGNRQRVAGKAEKSNPQCPPLVKKSVVSAPPSRLLAGSEASRAKEQALLERIRREEAEAKALTQFKARPLPKFISSSQSPDLRGLNFLETTPGTKDCLTPPAKGVRSAYEPHSTFRAKKRAEFEVRRAENEVRKAKEERKATQTLVQKKRRELDDLRQAMRRGSIM